MSKVWARRVLAGLAALAGLELVVGALAYRDVIDDPDWDVLSQAMVDEQADGVRLATAWLGPRARLEVPALADPRAAAAPDLHGLQTLLVVGLGDTWSDALDRELEGASRPNLESTKDLGPFTVSRYRFEGAPSTLADWTLQPPALSTPSGACRAKGTGWSCQEGNVSIAFAEVEYTPRRCFTFALTDGTPLAFEASALELGTALRGHVGVTDFNGRLRSDAAIRVQTFIDGAEIGTLTVTDAQGWRPFVVHTEPGPHDVRVVLTDTVQGTWGREGHDPRGARAVCFELRALGGDP